MYNEEMICPTCQSKENQVKAGKNQSGSQRFICKSCNRTYTPKPYSVGYPFEVRQRAIKLYEEDGLSFRAVARQLEVGTQSVINWVRAEQLADSCGMKEVKRPFSPNGQKRV